MSRRFRSWGYFFLILGILCGLYFWGAVKLDFGLSGIYLSWDSENKNTVVVNFSGLEIMTGKLYVTPFDSWDNLEDSILKTNEILYAQTYDFTEKDVKKLFSELLQNGTEIKLIMENRKYQQYQDTFQEIADYFSGYSNFEIRSDEQMGTNFTHSKIMLLDDELWVQTANLTHSSLFSNREHFFVGTNSGVYASLMNIFEKDWSGEKIQLEDIHPNLLVCDINCRAGIEELLSSAEKSIVIQTQYISDPVIKNIIGKKIEVGLSVNIILADTDENQDLVDFFGPEVARILLEPYNHTKMILIDDEILLVGSMNLSANSLDNNREIGIITKDKSVIEKFLQQFEVDWLDGVY